VEVIEADTMELSHRQRGKK